MPDEINYGPDIRELVVLRYRERRVFQHIPTGRCFELRSITYRNAGEKLGALLGDPRQKWRKKNKVRELYVDELRMSLRKANEEAAWFREHSATLQAAVDLMKGEGATPRFAWYQRLFKRFGILIPRLRVFRRVAKKEEDA